MHRWLRLVALGGIAVGTSVVTAQCGSGSGSSSMNGDAGVTPDGGALDGSFPDAGDAGPSGDSGSDAAPTNDGGSDDAPPFDAAVPDAGESVLMHHKHWSRDGMYVEPTLTRSAAATTANVSRLPRRPPRPWAGGEAVVSFPAGAPLGTPSYFAPLNWHDLDNFGQDLGGTGPLLIDLPGATPSKLVLALGMDGNAYLLDRTSLPGIGVAIGATDGGTSSATANVAHAPIISAPALYTTATATYVVFKGPTTCNVAGSHQAIKLLPGSPPTIATREAAAALVEGVAGYVFMRASHTVRPPEAGSSERCSSTSKPPAARSAPYSAGPRLAW
jgi:hypothetical protein